MEKLKYLLIGLLIIIFIYAGWLLFSVGMVLLKVIILGFAILGIRYAIKITNKKIKKENKEAK